MSLEPGCFVFVFVFDFVFEFQVFLSRIVCFLDFEDVEAPVGHVEKEEGDGKDEP